jgi:hypothetical protein
MKNILINILITIGIMTSPNAISQVRLEILSDTINVSRNCRVNVNIRFTNKSNDLVKFNIQTSGYYIEDFAENSDYSIPLTIEIRQIDSTLIIPSNFILFSQKKSHYKNEVTQRRRSKLTNQLVILKEYQQLFKLVRFNLNDFNLNNGIYYLRIYHSDSIYSNNCVLIQSE